MRVKELPLREIKVTCLFPPLTLFNDEYAIIAVITYPYLPLFIRWRMLGADGTRCADR